MLLSLSFYSNNKLKNIILTTKSLYIYIHITPIDLIVFSISNVRGHVLLLIVVGYGVVLLFCTLVVSEFILKNRLCLTQHDYMFPFSILAGYLSISESTYRKITCHLSHSFYLLRMTQMSPKYETKWNRKVTYEGKHLQCIISSDAIQCDYIIIVWFVLSLKKSTHICMYVWVTLLIHSRDSKYGSVC